MTKFLLLILGSLTASLLAAPPVLAEEVCTITTVAGTGEREFSGDGGPATAAKLGYPMDVALDPAGNLYIADTDNNRVRKVGPDGIITTVAGTGEKGFSGDGGQAAAAGLAFPQGVALDPSGNLYIADTGNYRVRKVSCVAIGKFEKLWKKRSLRPRLPRRRWW